MVVLLPVATQFCVLLLFSLFRQVMQDVEHCKKNLRHLQLSRGSVCIKRPRQFTHQASEKLLSMHSLLNLTS